MISPSRLVFFAPANTAPSAGAGTPSRPFPQPYAQRPHGSRYLAQFLGNVAAPRLPSPAKPTTTRDDHVMPRRNLIICRTPSTISTLATFRRAEPGSVGT